MNKEEKANSEKQKEYLPSEMKAIDGLIETLEQTEDYQSLIDDKNFRADILFGVDHLRRYMTDLEAINGINWIHCPYLYPKKDRLIRLLKMNRLIIQERLNEIENEDG